MAWKLVMIIVNFHRDSREYIDSIEVMVSSSKVSGCPISYTISRYYTFMPTWIMVNIYGQHSTINVMWEFYWINGVMLIKYIDR